MNLPNLKTLELRRPRKGLGDYLFPMVRLVRLYKPSLSKFSEGQVTHSQTQEH
jgi:hypothetical protein